MRRGRGTQCPYDPPRSLVVSGPYAYVANPMQVCKVVGVACWGLFLGNGWVVLSGVVYLIVTVLWSGSREDRKLTDRFGDPFLAYRRAVRRWWPRWRPHRGVRGRLYARAGCGTCRGLGAWIREREPVGLEIRAAESHPSRVLEARHVRIGRPRGRGNRRRRARSRAPRSRLGLPRMDAPPSWSPFDRPAHRGRRGRRAEIALFRDVRCETKCNGGAERDRTRPPRALRARHTRFALRRAFADLSAGKKSPDPSGRRF